MEEVIDVAFIHRGAFISLEEPFTSPHNWLHLDFNKQRQNWKHQHSLSVNSRQLFRVWNRMALGCFSLLLMGFVLVCAQ